MRTVISLRRAAATLLAALLVTGATAVVYVAPAQAADGFSVDDFAGNAMGTRQLVPANPSNCDITDNTTLTMGTGTMRVNANVPDSRGCNYASAQIRWTAGTSVNIEQNGADRIILKYRDVLPNQPSAVTFGLNLVDVNGRTATVGGLTRNGGAAGDWLTIRYTPEYVGDVSVLNFQSGFDKGHVKSVTLLVAATTNNQNVSVTFEGIGTNVGEPSYEAPSFGNDAAYDFPESTATTKTFTVTGNPAPDVSWTGKPSWMTITTSAVSGGRQVTMSGNPGTAYSDTNIAFHADVANSLTADASVRVVVPSPVSFTYTASSVLVNTAGPIKIGTVTSTPNSTVQGTPTGLPTGTGLAVSGGNVVLTGTPTETGTFAISATLGNEFRTVTFTRTFVVYDYPTLDLIPDKYFVRGTPITPFGASASGYPTPTVTYLNLPAGLTASNGIISGTPTTNGQTTVTVYAYNTWVLTGASLVINVGDLPTVQAPSSLDATSGTPVSIGLPVTGTPTSVTATGLPAGLSVQFTAGVATLVGTPNRPTSSANASGTATITATNSFGSDSEQLPWTVVAAPAITGPTLATTAVGTALTPVTITVTGYPAPVVTVTDPDDDGTLTPAGITVDQSVPGVVTISGTPTATGTEHLRISASNGVGGTITHDITVSARTLPAFTDSAPTLTVRQSTTQTLTLGWSGYPTATLSLQSLLPVWVTFDPATGTFTASPSTGTYGVFGPYRVDATNAAGTASAQVYVDVTTPAVLPTVPDATVAQGASVTQVLGTVRGYPVPTVTATGLPAGLSVTQTGANFSLTGTPTAAGGSYHVTLTAANGIGTDATKDFTITVTTPATLSAPASATLPVGEFGSLSATIGGFPLPTVVAAGLPAGLTLDPVTGVISGTPTATGTYTVTLSTVGGTAPAPAPVDVVIKVTAAPVFSPAPSDRTLRLGDLVGAAEFGIGGYPKPSLSATGLPTGVSLVESGGDVTLEGTPTETGVFAVTLTLTSTAGTAERTWNVTVEDPAQVSVTPSTTVDLGEAITAIPVTVSGYPSPTVTAAGLPDGLTLVSDIAGTRIIGTPTQDGHFSVLLTASNGVGTAASATIVFDVQSTPGLGGDAAATFPAGETNTLTLPVTGYPAPVLTTSALPSWLTFDSATAVFTATPTSADQGPLGTVTVTATSATGTAEIGVSLAVTAAPAAATTGGTVTILAGDAVSEDLTTVTGYPVPTVTASGLPDGLSVSLVGGVLTLTGSSTDAGSHAVTVTLANGSGPSLVLAWTVVVNLPAGLTVPAASTVTLGDELELPVVATGFPAPTVTVTGLPAGLTWQPDADGGSIVGSPTAAGTSTIAVDATNGVGQDVHKTFSLTVALPTIDLTLGAQTVAAGDFVEFAATGFQPDEVVTVTLHSTPVVLATLHADGAGTLRAQVRVPANTAVGSHTLIVEGATGASASAPITVTAAADELSGTGADAIGPAGLALLLLVAGFGVLAMVRRVGARRA